MVISDQEWADLCLNAAQIKAEVMRMEDKGAIRENTPLAIFVDILAIQIRNIIEGKLPHRLEVLPK